MHFVLMDQHLQHVANLNVHSSLGIRVKNKRVAIHSNITSSDIRIGAEYSAIQSYFCLPRNQLRGFFTYVLDFLKIRFSVELGFLKDDNLQPQSSLIKPGFEA